MTHSPDTPTQLERDLAATVDDLARERRELLAAHRDAERQVAHARHHVRLVREDELARAAAQRQTALAFLNRPLPDYSAAATACHRAHQHALRAEVLAPVENLL